MFIAALLLCAVVFVVGMLLMVIGNSMVSRAQQQMMEMTAERLERIDQHLS